MDKSLQRHACKWSERGVSEEAEKQTQYNIDEKRQTFYARIT